MAVIAGGLGCRLDVFKITRCSNPGSDMADALSKGAFMRFWALVEKEGWTLPQQKAWVPTALLSWVDNPVPDDDLGHNILQEIAQYTPVLSYNI